MYTSGQIHISNVLPRVTHTVEFSNEIASADHINAYQWTIEEKPNNNKRDVYTPEDKLKYTRKQKQNINYTKLKT